MHALPNFTSLVCFTIFIIIGSSVTKCDEEIRIGGVSAATPVPAVVLNAARIDEGERRNDSRTDEEKRNEPRLNHYSGSSRRNGAGAVSSAVLGGGTRDSQLLSLLAARRRRLLRERLAEHVAIIAALGQKSNRSNTTFAQLELQDVNNTINKRIVLADNNSSNSTNANASIRAETGDLKLFDAKPLNISKIFQESKIRAGFLNNRRKAAAEVVRYASNAKRNSAPDSSAIEDLRFNNDSKSIGFTSLYPYVPADEKQDVVVEEAIIDPEEEFQVDESNHGAILLNYSNSDNSSNREKVEPAMLKPVYDENIINSTNTELDKVEDTTIKDVDVSENLIRTSNTEFQNSTELVIELNNVTASLQTNSTDARTTKNIKIEIPINKENENNTLFLSDELYNHFRPLEVELPDEDMAPFLYFGQKLTPHNLNITSPNLPEATKSDEYLPLPEKKKFTSRYSATEKYTKDIEEELNEEMDVSVIKNVIEKNKIRNTAKQTPPRHIYLVNAYKKASNEPSKLNITATNSTAIIVDPIVINISLNNTRPPLPETFLQNKTYINLRNTNRTYFNLRRRPVKQSNIDIFNITSTTEKAPSTLVYTAVVTSVSVTSSMKGQNKTDGIVKQIANNSSIESFNNYTAREILNNEQRKLNSDIDKTVYANAQIQAGFKDSRPKDARPLIQRMRLRPTTEKPHASVERTVAVAEYSTLKPVPSNTPLLEENIDIDTTHAIVKVLPTTSDYITSEEEIKHAIAKPSVNLRPRIGTRISIDELFHMVPNMDPESETTVQHSVTTVAPAKVFSSSIENLYVPKTSTKSGFNRETDNNGQLNSTTENNVYYTTDKVTYGSNSSPTERILQASSGVTIQHKRVNNTNGKITYAKNESETETLITNNSEVVIEVEKVYTATYILAGLGFLTLTAIMVFVLRNFLVKKTKDIDTEYEGYFQDSEIKKESPITPVARPPMPPPVKPDEKWEFPRNKLRLQTLLGQGNFGQVWKAEADDLTGHDGLTRLVAVKTIKETATQKEKQELLHEICIMQKLETHPNVVTLLACCTEQEPYLLIMEYVMCGKLLTYLRERRSRPDRFGGGGGALTSRDLTVFAYCVARGMDYLASKGIIHRDLAARNILVDHNKLCKVADFGMSRASPRDEADDRDRPQRNALPVRWMAPEALLYNVYSHETDVWAYGVLLWEIVTLGSTPYAHMSGREVLHVVTEGYRLERPAHCKPQLYRAMSACWHAAPAQRPAFATLKRTLADLLDNEPAEGHYVDLESFYQDSSVYSDPSAIIQDDGGISIEYSRELKPPPPVKLDVPRRSFHKITNQSLRRNLSSGNYESRNLNFGFRDDDNFTSNRSSVHVNGISSPRMGGFGIRNMGFNNRDINFNDRKDNFNERKDIFIERKDIFNERKENIKLSGSSFHREREARDNALASRNSFNGNGFPNRLSREGRGFRELMNENGRNQRVSEFECDI